METQIKESSSVEEVASDLARLRILFVNVYLYGTPDSWVLIDAGLAGSANHIIRVAEERFGERTRPEAILLTHGHFDHVGAFPGLLEHWNVPVYAHRLELPYLTGQSDYPPPDPTVGKGAMALMSFMYPNEGINLGSRVRPLPEDGTVPFMDGWRWIHTPGHTPGHVSFFRNSDRCLIAGDAFVTTKQESLYAVVNQIPEVHGPPAYFTPDWPEAKRSVKKLAALEPMIAATGHGKTMRGWELREGLADLAMYFDREAVPAHGRYVGHPARADEHGVTYVPAPPLENTFLKTLGLLALIGAGVYFLSRS